MKNNSLNLPRIILRTDQIKKDGRCSVLLRVIIHGAKKDISLKVYCLEQHFDKNHHRIKRSCPDSENLNLLIDSGFKRAYDIIFNARLNYEPLTLKEFMAKFVVVYDINTNSTDFLLFIKNEIELEKKKVNKAPMTIVKYGYQLNKLTEFKSKINFTDLTETFLANFNYYMYNTLKNKDGGASNTMKFIRKFNNVAIKKGLTTVYPFKDYQIKEPQQTKIKYLTLDEVKKIKTYFLTLSKNHKHYRSLISFLFSCYTGLRYGDNKKFTLNDIEENSIHVLTEKTNKVVVIPLLPQAKELLNYELAVNLPNLNTPCDQTCNRALKEIAKECNINKPISTHYARHTFACIALNNGVSKPTVQSFLGHKTSKQTDHYAQLFDSTKFAEMAKLEGKY